MKQQPTAVPSISWTVLMALAAMVLAFSPSAHGQTLADYTAYPPFLPSEDNSESYPPNIVLLLDNSDSMNKKAYEVAFDANVATVGLFNANKCYQIGSGAVFEYDSIDKASISATCSASYPWDGNLLNWAAMRRIDIVKWALIGGKCSSTRSSFPPLHECQGSYLEGQGQQQSMFGSFLDFTQSVSNAAAVGRIPSPPAGTVYFHVVGTDSSLQGKFCLTGNSVLPSDSSGCTGGGGTVNEIRVQPPPAADDQGVVQTIGQQARFGLMEYNDPAFTGPTDGGRVIKHVDWKKDGDLGPLIDQISITVPQAEAQMAESLYEAARYYANIDPAYDVNDFKTNDQEFDPYWFTTDWITPAQYVPCCKAFVLLLTDGEPTSDTNIPAAIKDIYTPMDQYLDDVALWAHTTDLRQGTIPVINETGNDLPGFQNLTLYTLLAFGSGSATLQSAAKAGGFEDRNGNDLPDVQVEWDRLNNLTGAGGSDGVPDTYYEANEPYQLKDRLLAAITSILQNTGSGSAASVVASSSTGEGAVFQSFFFPSTEEGSRTVKWVGYSQALFLDAFGNLREDNGDAKLIYKDDRIIRTSFDPNTGETLVDRFADADGNGLADSSTPVDTVPLRELTGVWEAGSRLAQTASSSRKILTWVDTDNDGTVDGGERIDFSTANSSELAPYLRPGAAPFTADNIINFIRGDQIASMRDRQLTVGGSLNVWKLGDSIYATPIVAGAPALRFDIIYGDSSYTAFLQKYQNRRQVVYVGANDGMLHGFNGGYLHRGDDPSSTGEIEHGWFTRTPTDNSGGPQLGDELFGFIPQELLPHLKWLTQPDYTHAYYVDLTPKVTDVRIFTPDTDHPNGWGTILMGGFRLGGSCGACTSATGAPPMAVTADFNDDGDTTDPDDTRTFYSAFFVLDITNPESSDYPKLLWSYSNADLGLTTSVPSMLRVSPSGDSITDDTNAKWYMIMGSGPTGYEGSIAQSGKLYVMDLENGSVTTLAAESLNAFMGNTLTIDRDFDYRVDVTYMGSVIHDGSLPWRGKLYRLTTNDCTSAPCSPNTWGTDVSGQRVPTEVLDTFPTGASTPLELGPVTPTPAVAIDDSSKLWVFAGTGRFYDAADKTNTDQQYFVGIKDKVMNAACTQTSKTNCHVNDLLDVSGTKVCVVGVGNCGTTGNEQVTGVSGASDFPSLINLVASKDGWYTTLPQSGERALARPLVFGGLVLFPTFFPDSGTSDPCRTTLGASSLYALYYLTGGAYSAPAIGTTTGSGGKEYVNRSTSMGSGLATEAVVHIGKGGGDGKAGVFSQNSLGQVSRIQVSTTGAITSRLKTWWLHSL